jgi:hypothetical protein
MKEITLWVANGLMLLTTLFIVGVLIFKSSFFTEVIRDSLRTLFRRGKDGDNQEQR